MIDIKDFGAIGDGVADDGPAFQRAINAAFSGQGDLYISRSMAPDGCPKKGIYRIKTPIVATDLAIPTGNSDMWVRIFGDGAEILIDCQPDQDAFRINMAIMGNRIRWENLRFRGVVHDAKVNVNNQCCRSLHNYEEGEATRSNIEYANCRFADLLASYYCIAVNGGRFLMENCIWERCDIKPLPINTQSGNANLGNFNGSVDGSPDAPGFPTTFGALVLVSDSGNAKLENIRVMPTDATGSYTKFFWMSPHPILDATSPFTLVSINNLYCGAYINAIYLAASPLAKANALDPSHNYNWAQMSSIYRFGAVNISNCRFRPDNKGGNSNGNAAVQIQRAEKVTIEGCVWGQQNTLLTAARFIDAGDVLVSHCIGDGKQPTGGPSILYADSATRSLKFIGRVPNDGFTAVTHQNAAGVNVAIIQPN